ncbi:MAG: DUF4162 domain-containing protein, partial [Bacteroidales bacterium]|nr:DUF4162 domain-containing protein [Bacteroidales bacterium]
DPINANLLKEEILHLKKEGATIIFSTHNMGSVEELCDHITLINNGKAILSGVVSDIRYENRENLARLEFAGDGEQVKQIIGHQFQIEASQLLNGYESLLVKMPEGSDINQLLRLVMDNCHIHSCQEVLPSMSDVFIKVVNQNKVTL